MTDTDETPDGQPYHAIIRAAVLDGCIDATATDDADRIIEYLLSSGYSIVPTPDPEATAVVVTLEEPGPFGTDRPPRVRVDNCPACPPLCCDGHTLAPRADGGWTL